MKEREIWKPGKGLKIEDKQLLLDLVEKGGPATGQKGNVTRKKHRNDVQCSEWV